MKNPIDDFIDQLEKAFYTKFMTLESRNPEQIDFRIQGYNAISRIMVYAVEDKYLIVGIRIATHESEIDTQILENIKAVIIEDSKDIELAKSPGEGFISFIIREPIANSSDPTFIIFVSTVISDIDKVVGRIIYS